MKLRLETVSVPVDDYVIQATYLNANLEDIHLQFAINDPLGKCWLQLDTELRRLIAEKLAPGFMDEVEKLHDETGGV